MKKIPNNDFVHIDKEIDRQFYLTIEADKSLETKAIVLLGFITIGLGLLANTTIQSAWQLVGGTLLVISGLLAILSLTIRPFDLGPNPEDLVNQLKNGNKNIIQTIAKEKVKSLKKNHQEMKDKAKFLRYSVITLGIGIGITVTDLIITNAGNVI